MTSSDASTAFDIASTLQFSHLNRHPDPRYDANPSSSFSRIHPIRLRKRVPSDPSFQSTLDSTSSSEIPLSVLEPPPRRPNLPPLPDLRFEQSYMARIRPYSHPVDGGPPVWGMIIWWTLVDQVVGPLMQGFVWNLVLHGWRGWHTATRFQGAGVGAKIRRWWWGVNGWKMPAEMTRAKGKGMTGEWLKDKKVAEDARQFFENEFGSATMD